MAEQLIQKVAQHGREGVNYRGVFDLAKKGTLPISLDVYFKNLDVISKKFPDCLPAVSDIHCSSTSRRDPIGLNSPLLSFKEANKEYWPRYAGYHVSEDSKTGEKILFPLAEKLPNEKGNEITVADAKGHIIIVRLENVKGKPTMEYEYSEKTNETRVHLNTDKVFCIPEPSSLTAGSILMPQKPEYPDAKNNSFFLLDTKNRNTFITLSCIFEDYGHLARWAAAVYEPSNLLGFLARM